MVADTCQFIFIVGSFCNKPTVISYIPSIGLVSVSAFPCLFHIVIRFMTI